MIKLAIIDDHRIFVEGLQSLLSDLNDFCILHQFYTENIPTEIIGFEDVDVVLLDIGLGAANGIDLCIRIKKANPSARILFFSAFQNQSVMLRALRCGASGYLLKSCSREELIQAIKTVSNGKSFFSQEAAQLVMQSYTVQDTHRRSLESITPREKEILYWIINELSTVQIAEKLKISAKTVDIHRMRLLSKCGVKNTAGLVRKAIEQNIIS